MKSVCEFISWVMYVARPTSAIDRILLVCVWANLCNSICSWPPMKMLEFVFSCSIQVMGMNEIKALVYVVIT